jgi:hypothetical protein
VSCEAIYSFMQLIALHESGLAQRQPSGTGNVAGFAPLRIWPVDGECKGLPQK